MDIDKLEITINTIIEKDNYILKYNNSSILNIGGISCISGSAKSRKSFLRDLLTSKIYNPDNGFESSFNGNTVIIDTEMSSMWVKKSMERLHKMNVPMDKVKSYAIKTLAPSERIDAIEKIIEKVKPKVIIIDGIVDLLDNLNDQDQTSFVINKLMRWAAEYEIHVSTVLHTNPGQTDKVRGALGTAIQNKADTVLKVETRGVNTMVSPMYMRDVAFKPFRFTVIDNIPVMV